MGKCLFTTKGTGGSPIEVFKWSDGRNPGSSTFTSPEFTISTPKFMYFACSAKQAYENTLRLQGYNGSTWVNVASAPKKNMGQWSKWRRICYRIYNGRCSR